MGGPRERMSLRVYAAVESMLLEVEERRLRRRTDRVLTGYLQRHPQLQAAHVLVASWLRR